MSDKHVVNGGARPPAPPSTPAQKDLQQLEGGDRKEGNIWDSGMGQYSLTPEEIERLRHDEQALREEHEEVRVFARKGT